MCNERWMMMQNMPIATLLQSLILNGWRKFSFQLCNWQIFPPNYRELHINVRILGSFFSKERCIGKRSNLYQGTFNQNPNCGWFQSKLWGKSHIFILFFAIFRFTSNPVETAPKATSSIHMTSSQSLLINIETWTSVNLSIATELLLSQENSVFFTHFQVI